MAPGSAPFLRDNHELRAPLAQGPARKVTVHPAHAKPGAREQMLQLADEIPAHLECLDVTPAVDVVDQLRLTHLIEPADPRDTIAPSERAAIGQPLLGRIFALGAVRTD